MDAMRSCRCCLRCPADKGMTTPYTHLGKTEVYANMLKECFGLHLWVSASIFSGICSGCVGRLRDASDFKLQVQLSQVELLAELQGYRYRENVPTDESASEEDGYSERSEDLASPEEPAMTVEMLEDDISDVDIMSSSKESSKACPWSQSERPGPPRRRRGRRAPDYPSRPYQCHHCGSRFRHKKDISRHIQYNCVEGPLAFKNRNIKRYNCTHCAYTSKNKRNLHFHEMRHVGEKPYRCDSCTYQTTRKGDFERHQSIHTGDKPYKCNFCDYKCIQRHTLMIHKRRHTGEKPYTCNHCNRQFSQLQCLRKHQREFQKKAIKNTPRLRISKKIKNKSYSSEYGSVH